MEAIVASWVNQLWLSYQSKCSEFTLVVNNIEKTLWRFPDKSMRSADWDVCDPDICVMAPSQHKLVFNVHVQNMDNFRSITWNTLEHHVIAASLWQIKLKNLKSLFAFQFNLNWKSLFAQLALQVFPEVSAYNWALTLNFLAAKPFFQTVKMDQTHWSCTGTRWEKRVRGDVLFLAQTDAAHVLLLLVLFRHQALLLVLKLALSEVGKHVLAEVVVLVATEHDHFVICVFRRDLNDLRHFILLREMVSTVFNRGAWVIPLDQLRLKSRVVVRPSQLF